MTCLKCIKKKKQNVHTTEMLIDVLTRRSSNKRAQTLRVRVCRRGVRYIMPGLCDTPLSRNHILRNYVISRIKTYGVVRRYVVAVQLVQVWKINI